MAVFLESAEQLASNVYNALSGVYLNANLRQSHAKIHVHVYIYQVPSSNLRVL